MENTKGRLRRVREILEDGALDDMEVAADELATCTNEQKLARRMRIHAGNLREAADLSVDDDSLSIGV